MSNYLSHNAEHGGLMNKSIGDHYPYSVIGQGRDDGSVGWRVVNYLDDSKSSELVWPNCGEAHDYLEVYVKAVRAFSQTGEHL